MLSPCAKRPISCIAEILFLLAFSATARAHDPASQPSADTTIPASQPDGPHDLFGRPTLTDNWFGCGKVLDDTGLHIDGSLTQVYQQDMHGGLAAGRTDNVYAGRYEVDALGDLYKLLGLSGARFMAQVRGGWKPGIDPESVGSLGGLGGVNNAAEERDIYLRQLAWEQDLADKAIQIRIGKIDMTRCFQCCGCPVAFDGNSYANDETCQFLNGYLVNNPTIPFPQPGLGAQVHFQATDWWYLSGGVADADAQAGSTGFESTFTGPADFFSIYETGITPHFASPNGDLQGAYRAGFWYDPRAKERLDGDGVKRDDLGLYASFDQAIWRVSESKDDQRGLGVFGRYGLADGEVNNTRQFWSTGLQYRGLLPGRTDDVTGFAVAQRLLSPEADFTATNETVLEWYHNIQLTPWMHISPDVQYVFHPGGNAAVQNAVVIGVRVQMNF